MDRDFKGVWIPKDIWLNTELSILEKIILVEIDSLDNENHCTAGNEYFAEFCQCSESKITKAITKLKDMGLIEIVDFNGRVRTIKSLLKNESSKKYEAESYNLRPININNNSNNIVSKDTILSSDDSETSFEFGNIEKPKKQNLYQKCMALIDDYTQNGGLRSLLKDYLDVCMEMKCIRGANQWKGMLNTLEKIYNETGVARGIIVQQSITHGWKTFYPVNNFQPKNKCVDNVQSDHKKDYKPALDENGNPIVF